MESATQTAGITAFRRVESPSSINTYRQCPRKYYYSYIAGLPRKGSIHTVRGNVVHSVLEDFFNLGLAGLSEESYPEQLSVRLLTSLHTHWGAAVPKFQELQLSKDEVVLFYTESLSMLNNFLQWFLGELSKEMSPQSFADAFLALTPVVEKKYASDAFKVRGFIDAIMSHNGVVSIVDYKTSRRDHLSDEYRLQLGLYAMMYEEEHGVRPDRVGVFFLRHGLRDFAVDDSLIMHAKVACESMHASTVSSDMADYPKKTGPLCKWSSGQCDFYDACFGQKSISEF